MNNKIIRIRKYLLYGAWNENASKLSQNSSSFPTGTSEVNFWSTGLCCRSLMEDGLAPILLERANSSGAWKRSHVSHQRTPRSARVSADRSTLLVAHGSICNIYEVNNSVSRSWWMRWARIDEPDRVWGPLFQDGKFHERLQVTSCSFTFPWTRCAIVWGKHRQETASTSSRQKPHVPHCLRSSLHSKSFSPFCRRRLFVAGFKDVFS